MKFLLDKNDDLAGFLKDNIAPLKDNSFGPGYRVSALLKDNTLLPCVIFRNSEILVDLAVRRFKEELSGKSIFSKSSGLGYREIVKTFVSKGNCINLYEIDKIEKSHFAFPIHIQKLITGETSMSWTAFVAKFKDNRMLGFGTNWNMEFFQKGHRN